MRIRWLGRNNGAWEMLSFRDGADALEALRCRDTRAVWPLDGWVTAGGRELGADIKERKARPARRSPPPHASWMSLRLNADVNVA